MLDQTLIIQHAKLNENEILEICNLKARRWNYPIKEHIKWLNTYIHETDYHVLIKKQGKIIAYANLVNIIGVVNNQSIELKGIGNVCTRETGKGYGNILMYEINKILDNNSWKGLLFCKD